MKREDNIRNILSKLTEEDIDHLRYIEQLPKRIKYAIATVILITSPEGIEFPQRKHQSFDHNSMKDYETGESLNATFMDVDLYFLLYNCILGKEIGCFIEIKVENEYNSFENFPKNFKKEYKHLTRLIDCNCVTRDLLIFANHNVPYEENVKLQDMIIKGIYIKEDPNDEKGEWYHQYDGVTVLDLLVYLCFKLKKRSMLNV